MSDLIGTCTNLPCVTLDQDGSSVEYWPNGVHITDGIEDDDRPDEKYVGSVCITPHAALNLLAWLKEQEATLLQLEKLGEV